MGYLARLREFEPGSLLSLCEEHGATSRYEISKCPPPIERAVGPDSLIFQHERSIARSALPIRFLPGHKGNVG
jgi:hypothetical protein